MKPVFFASTDAFRAWLEANHDTTQELWVGYHKRATGKPSMTWNESVDEALCFGWIDGIRKSVDANRYTIRFTPRKKKSVWSDKNIQRMKELIELGRVMPAGLAAFERREEDLTRRYSFEQGAIELPPEYVKQMKANRRAWTFFQAQPPSYRRMTTWWIISAKREDTRGRRLATLIMHSAKGERIPPLQRP